MEQWPGRRPNQQIENSQAGHVRSRRHRIVAGTNAATPINRSPRKMTKTPKIRDSSVTSNNMSSSKTDASSAEGADGADAPRRHRCAKVEVLKLTSGRRPPHQYLYISTTYMSHANLCDFACLIAASPSSCSLDSSKSFSNGLIGTFGTINQASITMPPLEYAFQRGRMLFKYGCLKSCNSCSPNFSQP